jgi:hypothetical protein
LAIRTNRRVPAPSGIEKAPVIFQVLPQGADRPHPICRWCRPPAAAALLIFAMKSIAPNFVLPHGDAGRIPHPCRRRAVFARTIKRISE